MRIKKIDFTNPFIVRQWLKMLKPDEHIGYLIKENSKCPASKLGFTFDSNRLGLRGPSAEDAENVILGTSYGMGFGVDVGRNWYELGLDTSNWFNAALPVGPCEWGAILDRFYRGNHEHALFVYHPNFIQHGVTYLKWKESGKNVFDHLGWRTSHLGCAKLRLKSQLHERKNQQNGRLIYLQDQGRKYKINGVYATIHESNYKYIDRVHEALMALLCRFERVTVVRVGIKEQLVPVESQSDLLRSAISQYDELWQSTRAVMEEHQLISIHELPEFNLSAYNPYDTHWNSKGNELFAEYLSTEFNDFQ